MSESGEKQDSVHESDRVLLVYLIYKDSPIIILDDATNKLDSTSEKEILEEFFKLKNKIMIIR